MASRPHVLVLGGGYVPITLTRELRRPIKRGELDVTVVSRENFHIFNGFVGEMITGRIGPGSMLSPVRRIFAPAGIHVAEIESVDLGARKVVTSRHLDGARFELDYDHLVLCLGSTESSDAYPGLAEHAFKLKAFGDCLLLKNHLLEMFELADIERDPAERRRLLTFVVVGGGYAGTEIAGELADFARLLTKREYSGIRREECRVLIVHPGPSLLPELYGSQSTEGQGRGKSHGKLAEYATRHTRELGVELLLETTVVGATPLDVYLSNGEHVPTRTIVSAVGTQAPPLFDTLDIPRGTRGRVGTDACLRVEGFENVWAGGDCAAVPHPSGGTCPPVGIYALKHGTRIGKNLRRVVQGKAPEPFRYPGLGQGVSIGRRTAVGELRGIRVRGLLAWAIWRFLHFYYFPSWDRRLRLLADWLIWPLVGRDIVQLGRGSRGEYEIQHQVFQPGQVIADRARPVRQVHVIVEGEVELVLGEEIVENLRAGDHFGRKSIELSRADTARARTLVRTVALRADQANELQDVLLSTERIVARTAMFRTIRTDDLPPAS